MRVSGTARSTLVGLVFGIVLGASLGLHGLLGAEEDPARSSRADSRPVGRKSATEGITSDDGLKLARKLDEILKNQETILQNQQTIFQRLDAVMEELRIVKVRSLIGTGSGS